MNIDVPSIILGNSETLGFTSRERNKPDIELTPFSKGWACWAGARAAAYPHVHFSHSPVREAQWEGMRGSELRVVTQLGNCREEF